MTIEAGMNSATTASSGPRANRNTTVPVIVGVGQVVHHADSEHLNSPDPAALIAEACRKALSDATVDRTVTIDSLDVVDVFSWSYAGGAADEVAKRLGISPRELVDSPAGGEQPVALIDRAAARIAHGEISVALIAGGEAQATLSRYAKSASLPPWPPRAERPPVAIDKIVHPEAWRHGLRAPIRVYPLYENAVRAQLGMQLQDGQAESADAWSRMSQVAASNPYAWFPQVRSAQEIETPGPSNRPICHPYLKLMNAAPSVDQAAAVVVTSLANALEWGIPEDRLVFPVAAAGARELADPLSRPAFHRSAAMETTLETVLERAGIRSEQIDELELYSCFPCVPKMAARYLGVGHEQPWTVAGGLSFFGGPGNAYMLHAAAAIVDKLRSRNTAVGMLYGQGEFVTKHHALVLQGAGRATELVQYQAGTEPLPEQAAINADACGLVDAAPSGRGTVETYTAIYRRDGSPAAGIVIGRLDSGARFAAQTAPDDRAAFDLLTSGKVEPVGLTCVVEPGDPVNLVRFPEHTV